MNNKIIARIMAAVICVCMMSTVAFAADPTLTVDGDTATLSFLVGENGADISESINEAQITMMAYLVDAEATAVPAYTNEKIVAINQADGGENSGFGNVLIDASKLEEGKKIAVVLGGSDGTTETFFAVDATPAPDPVTYTVTFNANGGAFADATATKVFEEVAENTTLAVVLGSVAAPTKDEDETNTYAFAGWFTAAEGGEAVDLATAVAADVTVYAHYTATAKPVDETIAVSYELGNGTLATGVTNPAEASADTTIAAFFEGVTAPTLATYASALNPAFEGWYTDAEFTTKINTASTELMSTLLATDATSIALYARYTIDVMVGDINLDGQVNANDGTYLFEYASIALHPKNDPQRAAVQAKYPDYQFKKVYTVANNETVNTLTVGNIDFGTNVDANDGTYLFEYASIALHPKNDPQRAAVQAKYPSYQFKTKYTVYVK